MAPLVVARTAATPRNLTDEQVACFMEEFSVFDTGDGTMPARSLGALLRALGQNPAESSVHARAPVWLAHARVGRWY